MCSVAMCVRQPMFGDMRVIEGCWVWFRNCLWHLLQVSTKLLKVSLIDSGSALRRDFLKFVDVKLYCFIALLRLRCGSS